MKIDAGGSRRTGTVFSRVGIQALPATETAF
jgi:hypothetical protein